MYFAPIVEGHGEVQAFPALLHRVSHVFGLGSLRVNKPIRVKAGSFLTDADYLRRHVALASEKAAQESGKVIVLLDCEDHCPAVLGPELTQKVQSVRHDVPILVVLARREYETWFLAAARSLRGQCGLRADLEAPAEPESLRDAKRWLSERMEVPYDPVIHQVELSRRFDFDQATSNASFARFLRRLGEFGQE